MAGMKKLLLLGSFVGISGLVHATSISAPSSLIGFESLDGQDAYSWGVSISVPTGQTIVSAEIDFNGVTLNVANSSGTGVLYTDLLKSSATGVTTFVDNDASGDYFVAHPGAGRTALTTETFPSVGSTESWIDPITGTALANLNSYLAANNGIFDIGIDPDCHYSVKGITFIYSTGAVPHNTVPDAATTAFLMVLGLAGVEVFRRQFVTAKIKA
jgi:hypothetical protein